MLVIDKKVDDTLQALVEEVAVELGDTKRLRAMRIVIHLLNHRQNCLWVLYKLS